MFALLDNAQTTVVFRRIYFIIIKVKYIVFLTEKKILICYLYLKTSDQVPVSGFPASSTGVCDITISAEGRATSDMDLYLP